MDNGERWRARTLLLVALVSAVLAVGAIILLGQLRPGAAGNLLALSPVLLFYR
jgi:hypothetical protein